MTFHEDMKYWVWLQRAAGKGANLEWLLSPFGGDVRALYETDPGERERVLRAAPLEAGALSRDEPRSAGSHGGWLRDGWRAEGQEVLAGWQRKASAERAAQAGSSNDPGYRKPKKKRPVAESTLQRMKKVSLAEAEAVLELCERTGVVPICPEDEHYPWLLREIPSYPAVLYALGDIRLLTPTTLPFAMVGARDARLSSLSAASDLAGSLARAGFLIVSGGAIGTDSACHIGALNAGCPTVAVLGTGIGTRYLQQNADLRRVISHNGLLLSEMEPGEPGSKGSFPLRNRIIAGMSVGTLVVEAAVKSGSLITSKYAEEYDRDVFVPLFPGIDPDRKLADDYPTYAATRDVPFAKDPHSSKDVHSELHVDSTRLSAGRRLAEKPATPRVTRSSAFRGTRELLERETGVGIRCAADILAAYAGSYGVGPAALVTSGQVSEEDLTRDITDLAGVFPPLLSRSMVAKARAQLGLRPGGPASGFGSAFASSAPHAGMPHAAGDSPLPDGALLDLAGEGTLNPNPGWGPYRTAEDAELRTYTSAEFAYRRGDHPHTDAPSEDELNKSPSDSACPSGRHLFTDGALALSENDSFEVLGREGTAAGGPAIGALAIGGPAIGGPAIGGPASKNDFTPKESLSSTSSAGFSDNHFGESPQNIPLTPIKPVKDLSQEARVVLGCFREDRGQQAERSNSETAPDEASSEAPRNKAVNRKSPYKALYYDDFAMRLDMAPQYLLAALTELSLACYIDLTADQRYVCTVDLEEVWSS